MVGATVSENDRKYPRQNQDQIMCSCARAGCPTDVAHQVDSTGPNGNQGNRKNNEPQEINLAKKKTANSCAR